MEKFYQKGASLRATLKEMAVADLVHFPVSKMSVVRSTATTLGCELERTYKTKLNREGRTVDVTRLK